jgi:hypothetical protein
MSIRIRLGVEDLARVRFAISPVAELVSSLLILHEGPTASVLHRPWRRRVGTVLSGRDRNLLLGLVPEPGICIPDHLTPTPYATRPSVRQQIATIRATTTEQVRADLSRNYRPDAVPEAYVPYCDRPADALLSKATTTLGRYWEDAIAPHWPPVRDVLEADLLYRARRLAESGLEGLFEDLHPSLKFDGDALQIGTFCTSITDDSARGLVFIPSVFLWPRISAGGADRDRPRVSGGGVRGWCSGRARSRPTRRRRRPGRSPGRRRLARPARCRCTSRWSSTPRPVAAP